MILQLDLVASTIFDGLVEGTVLVLVASGLSLIFGLMKVVNFAHGSFYMIGAYTSVLLVASVGFFPALLAAAIIAGLIGIVIEYTTIKPLYDRDPLLQILVTFGLALMIRETVKFFFGTGSFSMNVPSFLQGFLQVGDIQLTFYNIFTVLIGGIIIITIDTVLRSTNIGSIIRGAARDQEILQILGINVGRYRTGVFAAGTALAGIAGALAGPTRSISPTMDFTILLSAFVVVIFGGLGSFRGSVISGFVLGQVIAFTTIFWSQGSQVIAFVILIVILLVRPVGLLGEAEVVNQ